MRWFTHKSVALAGAAWLGVGLPGLAGVAAGSILPDSLDMALAGRDRRRFQRIHRGFTHWGGWYIGLFFIVPLLRLRPVMPAGTADIAVDFGLGLALGALSHVLLDSLNPSGVPLFPLRKKPRLSLNLVSTGSWGELVFLFAALGLLGAKWDTLRGSVAAFLR